MCDTLNSCDLKRRVANNDTVLKYMKMMENSETTSLVTFKATVDQ